jgi:SAM-dependent methyltransferase
MLRHDSGDRVRLIEAARPQPPAMEWYRHEDRCPVTARAQPTASDGPPDHRRERRDAPVFEAHRDSPRHLAIARCRQHGIVAVRVIVERIACGQEVDCGPAAVAERVRRRHDRGAGRAARRQHEVDRWGDKAADEHSALSPSEEATTTRPVTTAARPILFDRQVRRARRNRIADDPPGFIAGEIAATILDRLASVTRRFADALVVGADPAIVAALRAQGVAVTIADAAPDRAGDGGTVAEEDALPFAAASFDLVVVAGCLDSVDDVPGTLIVARRLLRPDGLFLGAFVGGPSFARARGASLAAEAPRAAQRWHPQIDVRAAGDLLVRAGFALPVADAETLTLAYRDFARVVDDLRESGLTNVLAARHALRRDWLARARDAYAESSDAAGRVVETVTIVALTGWAPAPSQPQPARRGSATVALSEMLSRER